jgi:GNAT superfamily N-acetyltransferase
MNIIITPIQESDFEQLNSLFLEFATFEKLPGLMTNTIEQMKREKEYIKGFTAKNEDDEILGYAIYFYAYYTWSGRCLYMDDLYVREKYRGQKIGTMLINRVISKAKEENCYKLRWQVSKWNTPAINFYKSLGASINEVEMNCDLIM